MSAHPDEFLVHDTCGVAFDSITAAADHECTPRYDSGSMLPGFEWKIARSRQVVVLDDAPYDGTTIPFPGQVGDVITLYPSNRGDVTATEPNGHPWAGGRFKDAP